MTELLREVRVSRSLPPPGVRQAIRRAAGVDRGRMAAELAVHPVTVARWERGTRTPRGELRLRYAELLEALRAEVGW